MISYEMFLIICGCILGGNLVWLFLQKFGVGKEKT